MSPGIPGLGVSFEGHALGTVGIVRLWWRVYFDGVDLTDIGDRCHVSERDANRLDSREEAVASRPCGDNRDRRIRVAAVHRLVEVGLLRFRRQT
jgi:hypothetical protein